MPKLNEALEPLASSEPLQSPDSPRYGRLLVVLIALLLLLAYAYWVLNKPPASVQPARTPGISNLFSIYGWGKQRLNDPNGVAVDKSGNIYIADTGNHRVAVFSPRGNYRFSFGSKDVKAKSERLKKKELLAPLNIAVDDDYNIYVASSLAGKLSVFDRNGKFKRRVLVPDLIKIAIKGNRLYATTPGELLVMNLKGKVLKRIGAKGRKVGQFELPNGLALDKKGNIFVSDSQNMRLQIFDKKGKLIGGRGTPPKDMNDAERLFGLGLGLALDDQENVYVVDAFHHSVRVFSHDGADYGEYGRQGDLDGQFNYPSDIVFLGAGAFAVADKWNDRVQVVRIIPTAKGFKAGPGAKFPWWFWPLLLIIILILIYFTLRWVQGRRRVRLKNS